MKSLRNLIICLLPAAAFTAQVPDTDLWLFELKKDKQGNLSATEGKNITARNGYDNQPCFDAEGKNIFYSSIREDKQADIYSYNVRKKKTLRITNTAESEYSPVLTDDERGFFCVMVESDSAQRIHGKYLENGNGFYTSSFDSVGYYLFLNKDTLVYYKLTEPHSLRVHVISTGADEWLADQPLRPILKVNRHAFLFGIKKDSKVQLFRYDLLLRKAVPAADDRDGGENYIFHPDLGILKSSGSAIQRYDAPSGSWPLLFDLAFAGLKKITRFAIDKERKYMVVAEQK